MQGKSVSLLTLCLSLLLEVTGTLESVERNYSTSDFTTLWRNMAQVLEIHGATHSAVLAGVKIPGDVAGV